MLEAMSPEVATQIVGGHEGHGPSVTVGAGCSVGVGGGACGLRVGVSISKPIHRPKPKPAPDWVAPKRRRQTDHANEIQGPTGRQRSK